MNHLFMPSWTKVRCCRGYKIHWLQSSNFTSKFLLLAWIARSITPTLSVFLCRLPRDISSIKFGNCIPCYQATQWMTYKWNLLNSWVTFYNWYNLEQTKIKQANSVQFKSLGCFSNFIFRVVLAHIWTKNETEETALHTKIWLWQKISKEQSQIQ